MTWTHTYNPSGIPGPNPSGTITAHTPGKKISEAITELQEKVISQLGDIELEGIDGTISIQENKLNIKLSVSTIDQIPEGGVAGDVLTNIGSNAYAWVAKFPVGGKRYQVLQLDSDGEPIWDYVRAVEIT